MTAALERRLTEAEYLELERHSEVRHEFVDGRMLEIPGASKKHMQIVVNITAALASIARTRGCRLAAEGGQVRVPRGRYYYPDIMICCVESHDDYVEDAPCFLLEVLSPTTEAQDRGRKFDDYTNIPTLSEYVLVSQDEQRVTVFTRGTDDWRVQSFTSGEINVACLETSLTLEQLYAGVDFNADLTPQTPDSSAP